MKKIVLGFAVLAALLAVSSANATPVGKATAEMEVTLPGSVVDRLDLRTTAIFGVGLTDFRRDDATGVPPLAAHAEMGRGSSDAFLDVIDNNDGTKTIIMRGSGEISSWVSPYVLSLADVGAGMLFTVSSELVVLYSIHYILAVESPGSVIGGTMAAGLVFHLGEFNALGDLEGSTGPT